VRSPKLGSIALAFTLLAAFAVGVDRADAAVGVPHLATGTSTSWAPAATAAIHPGVQTFTQGAQCTADFVFRDAKTGNVFLGQGAHCSGTGGNTDTNGCTAAVLPEGTKVDIGGASHTGTIVYNSWVRMQAIHETNANACEGNDFALVQLDPADVGNVNPSIPFWGGPSGLNTSGTTVGESVYSYGNSELRLGLSELSPKYGIAVADDFGGWIHTIYTLTPGIPGDSGSAVLDSSGHALGVLRTIDLAPIPAANDVGDIGRQIDYMHAHSTFTGVELVDGTEAFSPIL